MAMELCPSTIPDAVQQIESCLVAVSTATAAVTAVTAPTSVPGASTSTTTATLGFGTRLIHVQLASTEFAAIQRGNGFFPVLGAGHFHKTEPPRPSGVAVGHQADTVHLSIDCEKFPEFVFRSVEVEVSNENVLQASALILSYLRVATSAGERTLVGGLCSRS